ncbi:Metallo-dependent hydrolase [Exidia glandulosa HHB12029]|uniref:Metallo-dependent hydrolase n=1 Tax=Exidia glandulosa HHB12029 TaxID=1314781 RepID=A0A165L6A2_EXIGL|nr:Metallo-dependent hydrolase [Exidia glandulosa HHB12029]
MNDIAGPAAAALASLKRYERVFISLLPKAELHAHLNGCIPLDCLRELARDYAPEAGEPTVDLTAFADGVKLDEIHDFFKLFPAIYALTATPAALRVATRAVLDQFIGDDARQQNCAYVELRTTPRTTKHMTRKEYLEAVLDEVELSPKDRTALLVAVDRRMEESVVAEIVDLAIELKNAGRRVVGMDLCGEPLAGDVHMLVKHLARAKKAGLGVTVHVAETSANTAEDTMALLSFEPTRLGHATFLNDDARAFVEEHRIPIEICLTSNLLCKTVSTLEDHHIKHWLLRDHPVAICTDDTLPFRTSLAGEYALLLAKPPLGLGLSEDEVSAIAERGLGARMGQM